jgi:TPR repeat protein
VGGVPRDRQRAFHYLERAAQAGNVEAQYNLGVMHAYGHGVERNRERSLQLFRQAADRGYVAAQNGLAVTLTDGSSDNNFTEAFIYFERSGLTLLAMSACAGQAMCHVHHSRIFFTHASRWRMHLRAACCRPLCTGASMRVLTWLVGARSALTNNADGLYNAALLLKDGKGVARDDARALDYLKRAADQDHVPARIAREPPKPLSLGVSTGRLRP